MTRLIASLLVGAVALSLAAPASAQTPSRRELDQRLQYVEQVQIEQQNRLVVAEERMDAANDTLGRRLDDADQELRRLRGELETANNENASLRREMAALRRELELAGVLQSFGDPSVAIADPNNPGALASPRPAGAALAPAESAPDDAASDTVAENDPSFFGSDPFAAAKARAVGALGATATVELPDTSAEALDLAKSLLQQGRFAEAESALAQFQARFPAAPELAEALYWRAETFYVRGQYNEAKDLYIDAIRRDRDGARAPDAMVRLGQSLSRMGFGEDACATLSDFDRVYPNAGDGVRVKARNAREEAGCS